LGRKSGSYKFEKRQKELKKQKKKQEKLGRRLNKGGVGDDDEPQPTADFGATSGDTDSDDSDENSPESDDTPSGA
jgi:hypothetical protein